jgi:hypothetical protein
MYHAHKSDLGTIKLKLATPILEFGTSKQSGVDPVGRTVKVSTNIHLVEMGLVRSVDCEHGVRMDWFVPAPAICLVGQVGIIVLQQYTAKKTNIPYNVSMYMCMIYFHLARLEINLMTGSKICLYS